MYSLFLLGTMRLFISMILINMQKQQKEVYCTTHKIYVIRIFDNNRNFFCCIFLHILIQFSSAMFGNSISPWVKAYCSLPRWLQTNQFSSSSVFQNKLNILTKISTPSVHFNTANWKTHFILFPNTWRGTMSVCKCICSWSNPCEKIEIHFYFVYVLFAFIVVKKVAGMSSASEIKLLTSKYMKNASTKKL